jgi:hypothetical protein
MHHGHPHTGDDRYWFHLLLAAQVVDLTVRPGQRLLLENPMVPIEMDLFHSCLALFLSWIPTRTGSLNSLPEELVVIDRSGAAEANRIFNALVEVFRAAPEPVEIPVRKTVHAGGKDFLSTARITYPRDLLVDRLRELAAFSTIVQRGSQVLFCSYWLERLE